MAKVKTLNPDKYQGLKVSELQDMMLRRDAKDMNADAVEKDDEGKLLRLGANGGASLLTGLLIARKPTLGSGIMGTPVTVNHAKAVAGAVGAYFAKDLPTQNALEGIAHSGLAPAAQQLGQTLSSFLPGG